MQQSDTSVEGRFELHDCEHPAKQLQDILSGGLRSFYWSAYRLLGNQADAEDALQDALFSAYKHLDQFRGQSQMSTWLSSIVTNCARMQLRTRRRQNHISLEDRLGEGRENLVWEVLADRQPNPEDECRKSELNERIAEFASRLSPALRRTFQLRAMDDLSICETASALGVPKGTVKAQLARARKKLKDSMRRERKSQGRTL